VAAKPEGRPAGTRRVRRWGRWLLLLYVTLLVASHLVERLRAPAPIPAHLERVHVSAVQDRAEVDGTVRITYLAWGDPRAPTVILLHGSPGAAGVMAGVGDLLADGYHVIAPDLPGFGSSTLRIPDYSIVAHASYLQQLLDSLGIERAHLVGFSMGGGVALELADEAPERVRSLTMLSAIGVQELELLGDYHLNHAIHGVQLAGLWLLHEAVPHFGTLRGGFLNVPYARNFYDTDQRPLRDILRRYAGPMLIIHGVEDPLVPADAAREHARIVPQAELLMLDEDHFMTFMRPGIVATPLRAFIDRVEAGAAPTQATASAERVAAATAPFDPSSVPPREGFALAIVLVLISVATLVSEDVATISAGLMVARGSITFLQGTGAALVGIFIGDLLLFLAGRYLGAPALARAPLRWFIRPAEVERSRVWFRHKGPLLVLVSRFVPGSRLPTYVAAGALRMPFPVFAFWFLLASIVWTPTLVALSVAFGTELNRLLGPDAPPVWPWLLGVLAFVVLIRLVLRLATWRGRRLLLSTWRRITEWEFWPVWLFYLPVVGYILAQGVRHRSLTLFTAANPALPDGGFAGESKAAMLEGLPREAVARFALVPASLDPAARVARATAFLEREGLSFPVVLKPDVGERGAGVVIADDRDTFTEYLHQAATDVLVQAYVPGVELGVFYFRHPDEATGHIFGITEKRLQSVRGDGSSTLETLILKDERAMRQARLFFDLHCTTLLDVPAAGQEVALGRLGNHCRGAVFLDGHRFDTPELGAEIDRISRAYDGFAIGRYDIRAPSEADLMAGRQLTVIELNGVSSEATNIYDPANTLRQAYATLFRQWRTTFAIAAANRRRGVRPLPVWSFVTLTWRHVTRGRREAPVTRTGTRLDPAALSD
jgi:pimeloyl-ACP methyl ester carboxylesterase/membrane protein DedA with SNARE-associated domain